MPIFDQRSKRLSSGRFQVIKNLTSLRALSRKCSGPGPPILEDRRPLRILRQTMLYEPARL